MTTAEYPTQAMAVLIHFLFCSISLSSHSILKFEGGSGRYRSSRELHLKHHSGAWHRDRITLITNYLR
jgi:hypothetical protein